MEWRNNPFSVMIVDFSRDLRLVLFLLRVCGFVFVGCFFRFWTISGGRSGPARSAEAPGVTAPLQSRAPLFQYHFNSFQYYFNLH